MTIDPERKTILLVDDDPEFLESARNLLEERSGGRWNLSTCPSGGEAMARLQKAPVDLIALDVNMPVLDGIQLLGLLQRRFPFVLKVVLTGEASAEQRAACLTAGAELVLDKPTEAGGWKSVYSAVESVLQMPKEDGFRGVLRKVSLPDVIQMECLAGNSSILEITGAGMRGRLHIESGQIIDGQIGDLTGVEALNNMLCLPGGSFHLLPFTDPGTRTISGPWEFLLMEAARLRDEARQDGGSSDPTLTAAQSQPDRVLAEAGPVHSPMTRSATAPAPASTPPKPSTEPVPAETTTGMQPLIKETLICSLQGEVLYEWNCPNPSERISLLEFITRRSGAMAACLPLGAFERFESVDKGVRCVAKMNGNEALFVRIQSVLAASPADTGSA